MRLLMAFTLALVLITGPVLAQSDSADLVGCSLDEAETFDLLLEEFVDEFEEAADEATVEAAEFLQTRFWSDYLPFFPECGSAEVLGLLLGRITDELLIATLYAELGDTQSADVHLNAMNEATSQFLNVRGLAFEDQLSDEMITISGADEATSEAFDLAGGSYTIYLDYQTTDDGFIEVVIIPLNGDDSYVYTGEDVSEGLHSDTVDIDLPAGSYQVEVDGNDLGEWLVTVEPDV